MPVLCEPCDERASLDDCTPEHDEGAFDRDDAPTPIHAVPSERTRFTGQTGDSLFRTLVHNSPDMMLLTSGDGIVRYVNSAVERGLGHRVREILGEPLLRFVHPDDAGEASVALSPDPDEDSVQPSVFRVRHRDGSWRRLEIVTRDLLDDPAVAGMVVTARDVTERTKLEEQLMRLAYHDALTDLPNRTVFMERLHQAAARLGRQTTSLAVLFLDIDRFKDVNDQLGHAAGDELLVQVARRLSAAVRPEDTVARLGGDEFTILLDGIGGPADATAVARRIAGALGRPFSIEGRRLSVSASIGVSCSRSPHPRPRDILRLADSALYRAKGARNGRFCLVTTGFED